MRGVSFFADVADSVSGTVPATVTVIDFATTVSFGPCTVIVYVVVALGVILRVPRAVTVPISGVMEMPAGFSVAQTNRNDWPGWIELGSATNLLMRAAGAKRAWIWP